MTFSELSANISVMKEPNSFELKDLTDEEIIELKQITAKVEMKKDICLALTISENDSQALDLITDLNAETLGFALAYKQLQLFFFENMNLAEGSLMLFKYENYTKFYNALKSQFNLLKRYSTEIQREATISESFYG